MKDNVVIWIVVLVALGLGYWYYKKNAGVLNTSSGPLVSVDTAVPSSTSSSSTNNSTASVQPTTTLAV